MAEPKPFSQFFEDAISGLRKSVQDQLKKFHREPEVDLSELQKRIDRSAQAKAFVDSVFWKHHFEPFLSTETAKSTMRPWKPGDPYSDEAVRTEFFFVSGNANAYTNVVNTLKNWVLDGEIAEKTMRAEIDKRKLRESNRKRREAEVMPFGGSI